MKPQASVSVWLTDDWWVTMIILLVVPVLIYFVFKKKGK